MLGRRLTEKTRREILVANAGRSGNFSLHHLYQLKHYRFADRFGVIIILCGVNDALLRADYEELAAWISRKALVDVVTGGGYYRHSYLVRAITDLRARLAPATERIAQDPAGAWYDVQRRRRKRLLAQDTITTVPVDLETKLAAYRSNVVAIIELCVQQNQHVIFVTQPTLWHKEMPDELADLLWQHTEAGAHAPEVLAEIISAYNAALQSVCKKYHVPCIDLAAQLPKDTSVFYDDCHFNVSGCDTVATILCEFLDRELKDLWADWPSPAQEAAADAGKPLS